MPKLNSRLDPHSAHFRANAAAMQAHVDGFRSIETQVTNAAEAMRGRYEARGYLMPRDRLALLLDRGSPFLELSSLAGYRMLMTKTARALAPGVSRELAMFRVCAA